jgi:uncharacterized protein
VPSLLTYPGVYVEEIPSGVRTIVGVATSITAFVGRAARGPINEPTSVFGFGDFERVFGGLSVDSTMSYAVRDFYLNRGSQSLIIRVTADDAEAATIDLPAGGETLPLVAASPGVWGNNLTVLVNHDTEPAGDAELFNLVIVERDPADPNTIVSSERLLNLSINAASPRYVPRVLDASSTLVRATRDADGEWLVPAARPDATPAGPPPVPVPASDGADGGAITGAELLGSPNDKTGIFALEKADLFNLLCIPPPTRGGETPADVYQEALGYCVRRRAMLLVDAGPDWSVANARDRVQALNLTGTDARNAAVYFPRLTVADPLRENQSITVVPSGAVAGVMGRTDTERGVWKAPAGLDASVNGVRGLAVNMTNDENGQLNPLGINCLRTFPLFGSVVWGARTMRGADRMADEWKYVPVRRLALFLEETLFRNTQWVVFEPNDFPLWAQIRLNIGAFMQDLFRQGAFQGDTPAKAYFVKCDGETTTQSDVNRGVVNIVVGFAPLKPAEFVVLKIQQIAGQIQT